MLKSAIGFALKQAKQNMASFLEKLDVKPTKRACKEIGIDHKYESLFIAIGHVSNDVYGVIRKAMYFYNMPSLHGMPFIGTRINIAPDFVTFKAIKKPKHLKAQWGGGYQNEHFQHVTWIQ
jgi:hypothetical protein